MCYEIQSCGSCKNFCHWSKTKKHRVEYRCWHPTTSAPLGKQAKQPSKAKSEPSNCSSWLQIVSEFFRESWEKRQPWSFLPRRKIILQEPPEVPKGNPKHHADAARRSENNDAVTSPVPGISQCVRCSETLVPQMQLPLPSKPSDKSNNPLHMFTKLHLNLFRILLAQFYLENQYRPSYLWG